MEKYFINPQIRNPFCNIKNQNNHGRTSKSTVFSSVSSWIQPQCGNYPQIHSKDRNCVWLIPGLPKIHIHLLCFAYIQDEGILLEMTRLWAVLEIWGVQKEEKCERTVSCGGPVLLTTFSDTQPFSLTNCGLFMRKLIFQVVVEAVKTNISWSVSHNHAGCVVLIALKNKRTRPSQCYLLCPDVRGLAEAGKWWHLQPQTQDINQTVESLESCSFAYLCGPIRVSPGLSWCEMLQQVNWRNTWRSSSCSAAFSGHWWSEACYWASTSMPLLTECIPVCSFKSNPLEFLQLPETISLKSFWSLLAAEQWVYSWKWGEPDCGLIFLKWDRHKSFMPPLHLYRINPTFFGAAVKEIVGKLAV